MHPNFQHTYEYVQNNFYSKSFAQKLKEKEETTGKTDLKASNQNIVSKIHGIQHVKAVADLIEVIDLQYRKYCDTYKLAFANISAEFKITTDELLNLVKIAALFHDSGRLAEGIDYWDDDSAEHCLEYLEKQNVAPKLAELIVNTIRYKDLPQAFKLHSPMSDAMKEESDFIRQLLNMADTIEVMRVREIFDMKYLPIIPFLKNHQEAFVNDVLKPHFQRIQSEKRAAYQTKFEYFQPASNSTKPLQEQPPLSENPTTPLQEQPPLSEIYRQQLLTLKSEYEKRKDSQPYLTFWGRFFGFSASKKLNAVEAILKDPLHARNPASLQGRLKEVANNYIEAYKAEHPSPTKLNAK